MNRLKSTVYLIQRGYRNTGRNKSLNIEAREKGFCTEKKLYQNLEEIDSEINEDDNDLDTFEADFVSAGKTLNEHYREIHYNKELLKARIVAKKYFKSKEPNFLTWSERSQMNALHNKDKKEWTPERLSTAFPALPETIKKILRTPYMPKTAEAVIYYDKNVINNWNKFKAGTLLLSPELDAHLQKFKNRNIQAINLTAIAERFVKPKPIFPSPQCTLFTSMVKDYTEPKYMVHIKPKLQSNNGTAENNSQSHDVIVHNADKKHIQLNTKYATSDVFLEKKVSKIIDHSNLSVEDQFFVQEYKDNINKNTTIDFHESIATKQEKIEAMKDIEIAELPVVSNKTLNHYTGQDNTSKSPVMQIPSEKIEMYRNSLETGIIKWKKKSDSNEENNYPQYIKVPYQKAKKGVTFKVNDCYYDCDGEFLYRIPGLKISSS